MGKEVNVHEQSEPDKSRQQKGGKIHSGTEDNIKGDVTEKLICLINVK